MAAIITDQIRILNAQNFVAGVVTSSNSYYTFLGLTNPYSIQSDWDYNPPSPRDSFDEQNDYWDTMVSLKKILPTDVRLVVPKRIWSSGTIYDYYRHDYSRSNVAPVSGSTSLYGASYYVMNSDYRVYVCLENGTDPDNPSGRPSLDEPLFVDLEPRTAGTSGDGYVWKYLYTIRPSEVIKFESTDFMPVPMDWFTSEEHAPIFLNAVDGSIKTVIIDPNNPNNRGVGVGTANKTYTRVPIKGDGSGAECTIVIDNDQKVRSVSVSNQGSGYTYGIVDLKAGNVPEGIINPKFNVIIPPKGGHGADIYRELGSYNVLLYTRIENDFQNPDFIVGNQIARVGIVVNPELPFSSVILSSDKASAAYAMKLTGIGYSSATFSQDSIVSQTVGTGVTAFGRVVNYDQTTGVLKYLQDRTFAGFSTDGSIQENSEYDYELIEFTSFPDDGGSLLLTGNNGSNLQIDNNFSGISTVINNRTYYLGQSFTNGLSSPEVKKYSGSIISVSYTHLRAHET